MRRSSTRRAKWKTLFLAVLGPQAEREGSEDDGRLRRMARPRTERERALGDVFWALVNSTEFNTNH